MKTTTLFGLSFCVLFYGLVLIMAQGSNNNTNNTINTFFTNNIFLVLFTNHKQSVNNLLTLSKSIDSSKTLVNPVVPQVYPILVTGRDINTILRSVRKTDKIDARDVVGDLTDLQGFDLSGGKKNLPTIILKTGRNLQPGD